MFQIAIPQPVEEILSALEAAGFPAVVVGGCVRDSLLGKTPHDWDVATAARPEEMKQALSQFRLAETGIRHGTLTVRNQGEAVETTTFRQDGSYGDSRHPDTVTFTRSLETDLSRRDFTVNAMAYSPKRGLVDLFGGQEDLQAKVLRCVGDPEQRFTEDALRIVRAMRFSAVLDFSIEPATGEAILAQKERLRYLARERIADELKKLLCAPGAARILGAFAPAVWEMIPELEPCFGQQQYNPHHFGTVWEHTLAALEHAEPILPVRLAVLLHDIGKPACFSREENGVGHFYGHAAKSTEIADAVCRSLRLDNALRERVMLLVRYHDGPMIGNEKLIRRRLRQLGEEAFFQLLAVQTADTLGQAEPYRSQRLPQLAQVGELARQILAERPCLTMDALAISGRDLIAAGMNPGPEMGRVLRRLLEAVSEGELDNTSAVLLNYAQQIREKI